MYKKYIERKQRQAGRRYEYYIAWLLRGDGWTVTETGREGFNDHGIDLIATRDGITRYVQCKGWKRWKMIHEDVVSHLFGSVAAIEGLEKLGSVEMYIYSPAKLDSYAALEADKLHITFVRKRYPGWHRRP